MEGWGPARSTHRKSGWFDMAKFEEYFEKIVLAWARRKEGRCVIIGDNLSSHVSPQVLEKCERNNIGFVLLAPNATHLLQPLDVSFFAPTKKNMARDNNQVETCKPEEGS